ncbi:BCCT family transporter [Pseudomonas kermanshahensis]|uniref:BCCT family transporter n=1 Tax=Pseudomonas kermanshahensis TaxID=2745482 RepID=A0ABU8QZW9_9PSED|nr:MULTISPECIES: BCCT family transporter [Pseudomonas]MBC3495597.1 BCCT family transporter [Pseudomonas sp. SWRI67]MBV4526705.1 BCCT family transporter [Pseudomonas kermanshahensis]
MRAKQGLFKGLNPIVTVGSISIVVAFVVLCASHGDQAAGVFKGASDAILDHLKWFYLALVSAILGLLVYIAFSRYGTLKLGRPDEKPEFSFAAWIAMLFSAGMGVGLIFWSVAEPVLHYASNPFTPGLTDQAASMAMRITLLHWGLHPWAIFTVIGLGLAYFAYREGLPLALRSILYPIIGNRIYGPIGHTVDIIGGAVTAFGVSQSLGLGVEQINMGMHQVFGTPVTLSFKLSIIAVVTVIASISLVAGVSRGMKRLSTLNMWISLGLMLVVLALGPTNYIMNLLFESAGDYAQNIIGMSFWTDAQADSSWQKSWTAFYWPWWMTWGPFVGLFIARISRGRTIRELVFGALLVPTLVTILWMAVFGGAALKDEQQVRHAYQALPVAEQAAAGAFQGGPILEATRKETTTAMFTLLDRLDGPTLGAILSVIICLLLAVHFVTAADAGTQVLCMLNSLGSIDPPNWIRVLWCVLEGAIAASLVIAGGLLAIQMASIVVGLPIAFYMLLAGYSLMRSLFASDAVITGPAPVHAGAEIPRPANELAAG